MPKNKDLKRLTRSRMHKTGESYTTARKRLLEKKRSTPPETAEPKADFAALAGMTDAAVEKATGRNWARWVGALDSIDATSMPHRQIAAHIHAKYDISGWWAQTVTVGYERIKGLREIGQRRGGTYETNKSKTLAVPIEKLYRAFSVTRTRNRWLPDVKLTVRKATSNKSMRITWEDETSVEIHFTAKGEKKSQVAIQHRKLPTQSAAGKMKEFWAQRLAALAETLAPAKAAGA